MKKGAAERALANVTREIDGFFPPLPLQSGLDHATEPTARRAAVETALESGGAAGFEECLLPPPPAEGTGGAGLQVDLQHLPDGAPHFLGREPELAELDAAWASRSPATAVVTLVAPGGVGKSALVKAWCGLLAADGWRGAERVYGWSFYSQGSDDRKQASEDSFLAAALAWFGVEYNPAAGAADKGRWLAEAVAQRRTLLLLDGVEPLQYPPGPLAGRLKAPGLAALLTQLAGAGQPGLCVVTSREPLTDLQEFERDGRHPNRPLQRVDLENLPPREGARLLHALGADRAGQAPIGPEDDELIAAAGEAHGHALTLSLLGCYLNLAYAGDIRQRDKVQLDLANPEIQGGHAFRVMAAYERRFAREGEAGARQLAALRLLGLFDRPAGEAQLAALRAAPAIPGLTEPLARLTEAEWRVTLGRLTEAGLLEWEDDGALDAHPLIRESWPRSYGTTTPRRGARATAGCSSSCATASPTGPTPSPACNRSIRRWPTAVRRGCIRKRSLRCTTTVFCEAAGTMGSSVPRNSAPSATT